jgi:[ribosomal protein S5]-alanine N-acetyltransferase
MAQRRVIIRRVTEADREMFIAASKASGKLHGKWVSTPTTTKAFNAYLNKMEQPNNCGLLVLKRPSKSEPTQMVGMINLTNIILGPLRSAFLGYCAFAGFERQGLMKEGLALAVRYGFGKLGLHRMEANIQPHNAASIALAKAVGFKLEGYSPRYLKIAGRWRDHERWAIVAD